MGGVVCLNNSFECSDSLLFRDSISKECEVQMRYDWDLNWDLNWDLVLKFIICFLASPKYCSSRHVYAIIIRFAKNICEQNFKRPIIILKKL